MDKLTPLEWPFTKIAGQGNPCENLGPLYNVAGHKEYLEEQDGSATVILVKALRHGSIIVVNEKYWWFGRRRPFMSIRKIMDMGQAGNKMEITLWTTHGHNMSANEFEYVRVFCIAIRTISRRLHAGK